MLLTVAEAALAAGCKAKNIYYQLYMCRIDGVRIRNTWRIISESLEEYCAGRENTAVAGVSASGGNGLRGCQEFLVRVAENRLQAHPARRNTRMEGRGRRLELPAFGHHKIPGRKQQRMMFSAAQLQFDF